MTEHSKAKRTVIFNISANFKIKKVLGQGSYGIVCLAEHKPTGRNVAIKRIDAFVSPLVALRTLREIKLLAKLNNHENIIHLYDLQQPANYDQFNEVYLIEEYMPLDLYKVIQTKPLTDDHFQYFTYQILRGLKFIHLANVIHRDLKPSNILVDANCEIKICDFGLSRINVMSDEQDDSEKTSGLTEYVMTRWYRAPEITLTTSQYSVSVDLWSLGCILAELFTSVPLFPGKDYRHQLVLILELLGNPMNSDDGIEFPISTRAKEFLKTLPAYEPLDLNDIFQNHPNKLQKYGSVPINTMGIDLLKKLLVFNPKKRINVEDALNHPYLAVYHDPTDEPVTTPIDPSEFKYDQQNKHHLNIETLKRELCETIHTFHIRRS